MPETIKYYVDINSGETAGCRSYLAEMQVMELTGKLLEMDDEALYDLLTDWDNPDGREALENGCVGWGPFTDQNAIVWSGEIGDETIHAVIDVEDAISNDRTFDCDQYLTYDTNGKHAFAVHVEKGGYSGEFELPADVEFDPNLLTFSTVSIADGWTIVHGVQYNGEDVYMEGDSYGKGSDYYTFEGDEVTNIG